MRDPRNPRRVEACSVEAWDSARALAWWREFQPDLDGKGGAELGRSHAIAVLLLHHAHTAPSPPSARTELAIPAGLDDLVLSCLSKDPADRPQSARELSRRLGEIHGANAWTEGRAREWWALHQRGPKESDSMES